MPGMTLLLSSAPSMLDLVENGETFDETVQLAQAMKLRGHPGY